MYNKSTGNYLPLAISKRRRRGMSIVSNISSSLPFSPWEKGLGDEGINY